ncbi:MAG: AAA family ATPase [Solirubrobacteraceae bacterium]
MRTSVPAEIGTSQEAGNPALLQALATPAMYPGHPPVAVHETHASWVFVAGDRAYKVKKPLALGFLDYSTLALRHRACREEVRVNRALAPGLYLGVRAIVVSEGVFRIVGADAPDALEYVVEMRSFDERDTLAGLIVAGCLTNRDVAQTAGVLASFHRSAEVAADWDEHRVLAAWRRNVQELEEVGPPAGWRVEVPGGFGEAFVRAHAAELRERSRRGLGRDGHGDLRCEHVLARPCVRVVDRVEFDPALRRTDVACDLAFLTMDLEASGARWAGHALVEAYRDADMDPGGEQLRSFYAAHWALVRSKVSLIAASEHEGAARKEQLDRAGGLWSLAERLCWRARAPLAVVVCGPPATGKSVLARELSRRSELPVVSSDVVRKRMAHLSPSERARAEHYAPAFTRATYAQLSEAALIATKRSGGVIVDATCGSREARAELIDGLGAAGVPLLIVRCQAPLELVLARAAERMHERGRVSDATPQIAREQFCSFAELDEVVQDIVLELDTTRPPDVQVDEIARALDAHSLETNRALPR